MELRMAKRRSELPEKYRNYYLYRLDLETTHMVLTGNKALVDHVTEYLRKRVSELARRCGVSNYAILPGYGKRNIVLLEGSVY